MKNQDTSYDLRGRTENLFKVIIAVIDDGEPPTTSPSTHQIYLRDINDYIPRLVKKSVDMFGNKGNKVMVSARDSYPYTGPSSSPWRLVKF